MERASDILESFFRRTNIAGGEQHVAFYRSWEEIVGPDLASHISVTDIRNHALCIEVDHPAWMQQVQLRQARILKTVQTRFPKLAVTTLHILLVEKLGAPVAPTVVPPTSGSAPSSGSARTVPLEPAPPPSRDEAEALARIDEPRLRDTLARLREAIAQRAPD